MNNQEEHMQILKMVESGQITSDEGMKLLDAVGSSKQSYNPVAHSNSEKLLKVRVIEDNENVKVNVNIPLALIEVLADVGLKFLPVDKYPELKEINIKQILDLVHSGVNGKLVDISAGEGTLVEVFIE